jgi:hypothetical protein
MLYASVNSAQSPKTATDWSSIKINDSSKETKHTLHHLIDMKHASLHVKFEGGLFICLTENFYVVKRNVFHRGRFALFQKRGLNPFKGLVAVRVLMETKRQR